MEKKEFPISRFSVVWGLAIRLILAVSFLMLCLDQQELVFFLIACLFLILTVHFLKRPHKIVIDSNEIVFMCLLFKPIRLDVDNLLSIQDVEVGGYTKFNSEKKTLTTLSKIKNRDELFNYIHSLNSNINFEIKQVSGIQKGLSAIWRFFLTTIVLFIFLVAVSELFFLPIGHQRSPNSMANADLKNAYTCAKSYFEDHPNGVVTLQLLEKKYGFVQWKGTEIRIISGTKNDLKISSTHPKSDKIYEVDAKGNITFRKKNR